MVDAAIILLSEDRRNVNVGVVVDTMARPICRTIAVVGVVKAAMRRNAVAMRLSTGLGVEASVTALAVDLTGVFGAGVVDPKAERL